MTYLFCINILDIPIFSCAMYHMAPKGETKTTCWTWWSLDSRISSWCFNQLEGHSFEVTVLDPTPATMSFPTWVAPCGVALHMWRRSLCCWPYFPGSGTPSLVIMVMAYVQLMHFDMWWYDYHVAGKFNSICSCKVCAPTYKLLLILLNSIVVRYITNQKPYSEMWV